MSFDQLKQKFINLKTEQLKYIADIVILSKKKYLLNKKI